jgi:hypothetical protein
VRSDPGGCLEYPRADAPGEVLQHAVVAFAGECHPQQSARGGRQQQRSDGGIHSAVGDVEQITGLGVPFQAEVQPAEMVLVDGEVLREVRCGHW